MLATIPGHLESAASVELRRFKDNVEVHTFESEHLCPSTVFMQSDFPHGLLDGLHILNPLRVQLGQLLLKPFELRITFREFCMVTLQEDTTFRMSKSTQIT